MAVSDPSAGRSEPEIGAKTALWNDPVARGIFFQLLTVGLIVLFVWSVAGNVVRNLEASGIASGYGFLDNTAGYAIAPTLGTEAVSYTAEATYWDTFLVGIINTIAVALTGIVLATLLGFLIGVGRLSSNWVINRVCYVYIEVVRNIPLLLQILFWYIAVLRALPGPRESWSIFSESVFLNTRGLYLPNPVPQAGFGVVVAAFVIGIVAAVAISVWAKRRQEATGQQFPAFWTGVGLILGLPLIAHLLSGMPLTWDFATIGRFRLTGGMVIIPEFLALLFALSMYTAAFIAEIVRAGIQAVSKGQTEAAYALGLRPSPTLNLVIIPQAMRVIIPPLTSQYLNLTKNSSLAAAIAYPELVSVFGGTTLNQVGQAIEVLSMVILVYLMLSLLTSAFMNWFNSRMRLVER